MAERDAFGRLPDENPLAGLGALSDGTTNQAGEAVDWVKSEPATAAEPAAPDRPAQPKPAMAAPSEPRPANPAADQTLAEVIRQAEAMSGGVKVVQSVAVVGRIVKVVMFLVVLGVIASVAKPVIDAGNDVRDAVGGLPSPGKIADDISPPASTGGGEEAKAPTGLSSNSMLTRRNLGRAMDRLRRSGLGRMRSMSIRPERIDAQLLTRGGKLRSVQIKSDDRKINDLGASGGGASHLETIPFAKIDVGGPARLARSAAGRVRKPVSQIDYIVLISFNKKPMWSAFTKSGKHFLADAHGRITSSFK